ncbi:MAG: SycD/LcrH family type III secretion system chaperone [Desulfovibrio sp.]|jgi:type III secretion system low calcium response chaperone LcrH/SycD|nr:SycD/LcrH family type III secretion system chaperone [Desulfovibrio sp.]
MNVTADYNSQELGAMLDALLKGATLGDVAGVDKEALEAGYALAYSLYSSGNFKDAETMFKALCLYDNNDERFWLGLAGCRQMNGDLAGAVDAYAFAGVAGGLSNPSPLVHAGLCWLKLGDKENAAALFRAALELGAADNDEHEGYRERAHAVLDLMDKEERP